MSYKKLIPFINGENELAANVVTMAEDYCFAGADELFLYNYSKITEEREEFLATLKEIDKKIDIPFIVGMYAARFEDVKKAFYTGADRVVVKYEICPDEGVIKEAAARFGEDKILVEVDEGLPFEKIAFPVSTLLLKHVNTGEPLNRRIKASGKNFLIRDSLLRNDLEDLLKIDEVQGVATNYFERRDLFKVKRNMEEAGIEMNTFKSAIPFSEFKTDDKGLVPCIVQDYRTGQVLMLAYMNEESYQATCETGKMTYFSRSRQELWCKGDTSGHYQYVKELSLDCDNDTILAKANSQNITAPRDGKTVYVGSDWKEVTYRTTEGNDKTVTIRTGYEIIERTIDKYGQFLLPTDLEVNTWWTNTGMEDSEVIQNYHAHGECEQFHSEIKTDMDVERLPSGKFDTNELVLELTILAYNILRMIGQETIGRRKTRHKVHRRRLRTVISNMILMASHVTEHARQLIMGLGQSNVWRHTFAEIYTAFAQFSL